MSYQQQLTAASLTPSRPAPQAPLRRPTENSSPSNSSPLYTTTSLAPNSSPLSYPSPSPSGSSYGSPYSGIGGTPNRGVDDMGMQVVRTGTVNLKEEGFGNWLFNRRYLILREQSLAIHKNEVRLRNRTTTQSLSLTLCVSNRVICGRLPPSKLFSGSATSQTSNEQT